MVELSIIIPAYNVERFLSRCLDSILIQSFSDFEIILVDDASKDNTATIINTYADLDKRINPFYFEYNQGPSVARQYALDHATGTYIMFMDADDRYINKNALRLMVGTMKSKEVDCVSARYQIYYNRFLTARRGPLFMKHKMTNSEFAVHKFKNPKFYWHYLVIRCYKASIIREHNIRFDSSLYMKEDMKFNYDYMIYAKNYDYITACIYEYNCANQSSLSKTHYNASLENQIDLLNKAKKQLEQLKEIYIKLNVYEQCKKEIAALFYTEANQIKWNFKHNDQRMVIDEIINMDTDYLECIELLGTKINYLNFIQSFHRKVRKYKNKIVTVLNRVVILFTGSKSF